MRLIIVCLAALTVGLAGLRSHLMLPLRQQMVLLP